MAFAVVVRPSTGLCPPHSINDIASFQVQVVGRELIDLEFRVLLDGGRKYNVVAWVDDHSDGMPSRWNGLNAIACVCHPMRSLPIIAKDRWGAVAAGAGAADRATLHRIPWLPSQRSHRVHRRTSNGTHPTAFRRIDRIRPASATSKAKEKSVFDVTTFVWLEFFIHPSLVRLLSLEREHLFPPWIQGVLDLPKSRGDPYIGPSTPNFLTKLLEKDPEHEFKIDDGPEFTCTGKFSNLKTLSRPDRVGVSPNSGARIFLKISTFQHFDIFNKITRAP